MTRRGLVALTVMAFALTACSNDAFEAPPDRLALSEPAPTVTPVPTPTAAPEPTAEPTPTPWPWRTASEARSRIMAADQQLDAQPVAITGTVAGHDGPVGAATVGIGGQTAVTDPDGRFLIDQLRRRNAVLTISARGFELHRHAVVLDLPATSDVVDLGTITLTSERSDVSRLVFGGDVALGRRFIDPEGLAARDELPKHDDAARIGVATAHADTVELFSDLSQMVEPYDFVSVNLESVVTSEPDTPWEERNYLIFSLPESIRAMPEVGIDHVSLGNNHLWDYNQKGIEDSLASIDAVGLGRSGAGTDSDSAFVPYVGTVGEASVAVHSFVSIEGVRNTNYTAARSDRGGAADLNDGPAVKAAIEATVDAGHLTVAVPHTGYEYTERPPPDGYTQRKMRSLAEVGADLVIAGHPHVPQGFEFHNDVLIAHSLGNLAFDQVRLDTTYGVLVNADFVTTESGHKLDAAHVVPVLIDDFAPTWAVGERADHLLRRLSWSGSNDVVLVATAGGARIERRDATTIHSRTVEVDVVPDASGVAHLDLRSLRLPDESIASIQGVGGALKSDIEVSYGRDLMLFGDMEDHDVDDVPGEVAYWANGEAGFRCSSQAYRGTGAMCSIREADNQNPTGLSFTRRIRVIGDRINEPNKDLTLLFYSAADNRGEIEVEAVYMPSQGSVELGTKIMTTLRAGTSDYRPTWLDVALPVDDPRSLAALDADSPYDPAPGTTNARAVRFRWRHYPPESGTGLSVIDDAALISWESPTATTPNPFDFVRLVDLVEPTTIVVEFVSYT